MNDKTVQSLAEVVGIPLDRFLEQLKEAGLSAMAPDDLISDEEKVKLLAHLRKRHGKADADQEGESPKRITLKRSTKTELRQSSAPGTGAKTVSVEVRKQKTYIKRSEAVVTDDQREAARAKQALAELERQKQLQAAEEEKRRQHELQLKAEAEKLKAETETEAAKSLETQPVVEAETAEPRQTIEEPVAVVEVVSPVDEITAEVAEIKQPAHTEEELLELEKKQRLEAAVERNAEKVRKAAEAKQQTLHKK